LTEWAAHLTQVDRHCDVVENACADVGTTAEEIGGMEMAVWTKKGVAMREEPARRFEQTGLMEVTAWAKKVLETLPSCLPQDRMRKRVLQDVMEEVTVCVHNVSVVGPCADVDTVVEERGRKEVKPCAKKTV